MTCADPVLSTEPPAPSVTLSRGASLAPASHCPTTFVPETTMKCEFANATISAETSEIVAGTSQVVEEIITNGLVVISNVMLVIVEHSD